MGMKMGSPDARHVIGDRCHTFDRLSCQAIYDCPIRLGRNIAIPFDKLSNDFIVDINHFIDDIPNQRAHRGHPDDRERRGHHDLKVSLLEGDKEAVSVTSWHPTAHNGNRRFMTGLKSDKSKCASSTTTQ